MYCCKIHAAVHRAVGNKCWYLLTLVLRKKSVVVRLDEENDYVVWQWTELTKFINLPAIVSGNKNVSAD